MTDGRVLVIAAHPDDELLGCGATVASHVRRGDTVTSVIACEGEFLPYGPGGVGQDAHTRHAARGLGVTDVRCLRFPDQRLDTVTLTEVIGHLVRVVDEVRPHVVYGQFGGDVNRDPQMLFQALLVATRPTATSIRCVYPFDTASSTEWAYPRSFVPDTCRRRGDWGPKLRAMACHGSELAPYPHPRSLEALELRARAWGAQVCMRAAEVFMTVRRVRRGDDHGR
jgi:LmbE family N-acetylglucosaminyl deacetylase